MINPEEIARLLCEDDKDSVFSDYQEMFREHTVLDEGTYGEIVGILKDVAKKYGLILDHRKLKVKFNPAGLTIKNIYLSYKDPSVKKKLAQKMAEITGDDNIKNTFSKHLRINLYNAINHEFAQRVRDELNLEVTHQSVDPDTSKDPAEALPMATFTQPPAVIEPEPEESEEELGVASRLPERKPTELEEPEKGPEEELEEPREEEPPELPKLPEIKVGEEENPEEEIPEKSEEEKEISFEDIRKIASYITEDPDIFTS